MTTVRIMKNNNTTYEVSFDSYRKAKNHFNKLANELHADKTERSSISSFEEGMTDRIMLMRGRFVDIWRAL